MGFCIYRNILLLKIEEILETLLELEDKEEKCTVTVIVKKAVLLKIYRKALV